MLDLIKKHKLELLQIVLLIASFGLVRGLESYLFYDPFIAFFKGDYQYASLPKLDYLMLFFGLLFRYGLNTILSLLLLYVIFKDKEIIRFTLFLYLLFFVVLILLFFSLLYFKFDSKYFLLFYVRRFLIQPLFVILFIPAFYFQKSKK